MRFRGLVFFILPVAIFFTLLGVSCKKEKPLTTGGTLRFSDDTLKFDTVFTASGSFTNGLLIYNPQNQEVVISSIRLQNGASSYFHLNVNGFKGNSVTNIKIPAHDSIYVFATVNINPNDSLSPFLITDELIAVMNGKQYTVPFTAYGQNAHYIVSDSISRYTKWLTDLPYVVIHRLSIGPTGTLEIPANCRVYMHQDARFFVYGTLNVNPTGIPGKDSVVFQGDRLDRGYFGNIGYPGEWGGFYFVGGDTLKYVSTIRNAIIKNCGGASPFYNYSIPAAAVQVNGNSAVIIDHTVIKNSIGYGILNWGGYVVATSCLVHTTGGEAFVNIQGGYDSVTNCTFANYGTAALSHSSNGTVTILNYFNPGGGQALVPGPLYAVLTNCIVYGSLDSEVICDAISNAEATLKLDHCLLKMGNVRESFINFNSCVFNKDPLFKDQSKGDFHLQAGSAAAGSGVAIPGINDLEGNGFNNEIGCYRLSP
jgi:hypothetical protein